MLRAAGLPEIAGLPEGLAGITADSRAVTPGMLYAALPGARVDGRAFIADAVGRGAVAVLAPSGTVWPEGVPARPLLLAPEPRQALARLAAAQAGAQPETVVAVTGTNGKTSTAEFLRQIFGRSGRAAASLGTLGVIAPGHPPPVPGLTTLDPITLAETLAQLAREGVTAAALEASSHGLDQFRLDGVRFAAAGFTNLTRDHLDYHGTLDDYRTAKLRLFRELLPAGAPSVAMADLDPATLAAIPGARTVGVGGTLLDLASATPRPGGQTLVVNGRTIELALPGRFQVDNALLAAGLALVVSVDDALDHLPALTGVRGRMELAAEAEGAAIYVDYAHTPDALERLLTALRPHTTGRLHVVFGAGGDRDRGKRPLMGEVSSRLADFAIVTDDNPRGEEPASIRAAIRAACPDAREIGDRETAIAAALDALRPGDVLAIAGKGHEQGQTIGGVTLPFDDVATVRRLL